MSRTYSSWRSFSPPNRPSSSTSENPITAFSGVRSSCDMLARNSDLCPLATSSSRAVCTFWIAIAPCAANVVTSSIVRSSNGATASRQSTITPSTRSPSSIGTPIIVRNPPSSSARCIVYSGSAGASRICTVWRSCPTRPTIVPGPAAIGTLAR